MLRFYCAPEFRPSRHGLRLDQDVKLKINDFVLNKNMCLIENRFRLNKTIFYCQEKIYFHGEVKGRLIVIYNQKKAIDCEESKMDEIQEAQLRRTFNPEVRQFQLK